MMDEFKGKGLIPNGDALNDIIQIGKLEGFKDPKFTAFEITTTGDNFMGGIVAVSICEKIFHSEKPSTFCKKPLNLILKYSPRTGKMRECLPINDVFAREVFFYKNYLPKLYQIQDNFQTVYLSPCVKIYKVSLKLNDEYVVMSNLLAEGFCSIGRKTTMDYQHTTVVLKQLGYLHGLGYVYKARNPVEFQMILNCYKRHTYEGVNVSFYHDMIHNMIKKAATLIDPIKEKITYEKTKRMQEYGVKRLLELAVGNDFDDKYSVVIHGDCWNNNILFKYDNNKNPIDIRIIDWQLGQVASPALDLTYFIYLCTGTEVREKHFDDFLQIYYDALAEVITASKLNPDDLFPYTVFQSDIEKYFNFGVIQACHALSMFTRNSDEIPSFHQIDDLSELAKLHQMPTENEDLYVERITGVLRHAAARNFI